MPLYEYHCQACGQEFELLVRSSDRPQCAACGSEQLTKQFSVPAAHTSSGSRLPIAGSEFPGCGKPGCGPGGCGRM
ncbi:MAG TPA: zinc ribbon domain-containing protein [Pirellulales bacterium]|nr:zinc ribbon domain-containing protein [Pirellulales bacterium]